MYIVEENYEKLLRKLHAAKESICEVMEALEEGEEESELEERRYRGYRGRMSKRHDYKGRYDY